MFEQTFKAIDDVLWKEAGCTTELDDTEQTSRLLFLKYLDDPEHERALTAQLEGRACAFILEPQFRQCHAHAPARFRAPDQKLGSKHCRRSAWGRISVPVS